MKLDLNNIKLLGDNILVKRHEKNKKVSSILIAAETAYYDNEFCDVIAVGTGVMIGNKRVPLEVSPGDIVIVKAFDGDPVDSINYPGLLTVKPSEIACVVEMCQNANYDFDHRKKE